MADIKALYITLYPINWFRKNSFELA